jgi:K+-transporting ATPase A subunit
MKTSEIASVAIAFIVLAGLAVAVAQGSQTASVMNAGASGFSNIIKAAAWGK